MLLPDRDLFIVADGMGGHQGGEVASRLAIETLQVAYQDHTADALDEAIARRQPPHPQRGRRRPRPPRHGHHGRRARAAADEPDDDGDDEPPRACSSPTSATAAATCSATASLAQLTEDHSVVADLVREGRITAEEAEVHPQRNIVTRVLGVYETVEVDLWPVDPVVGDRYLLCSDGLFNEVGADQIGRVLRRLADPTEAAAELVRLANEGGGRDNITAVVVDVVDDGGVAEAASAALAGEDSRLESADGPADGADDPAGFTTALPGGDRRRAAVRLGRGDEPDATTPVAQGAPRGRRARTRFTWRVAPVRAARARRDRRRHRHHPVVRHEHLLRRLRRRRGRDLPGPARRHPLDRSRARGAHRHRPGRRARALRAAASRPATSSRPWPRPSQLVANIEADIDDDRDARPPRRTTPDQHHQHDRGLDDHPGQLMLRAVRRNTELGLIVLGTLVTVGAYVLASLAEDATIPANIGPFLGDRARAAARRPPRHPPPRARRRRHAPADRRRC